MKKSPLTGLNGSWLDWISKGAAGQEGCNEQSALSVIYHILAEHSREKQSQFLFQQEDHSNTVSVRSRTETP